MADTDIKIKLTADPKPVRDAIKLIDKDLKELGGSISPDDNTTTPPPNPPNDKGGDNGQTSPTANSDRVNQNRRDRTNTLILRELVALRRELQKTNQHHASPPSSTGTPPGPIPPPLGGPTPPPPPSGSGSGGSSGGSGSGSPLGDNSKIVDAIGKLGAMWSAAKMINQWTNTSQSRESLAYKTYGSLLAYTDYNVAGQDAVAAGKRYGYDYDVTMAAQKANMRYAGYANMEALEADTQSILGTSKVWGLDTSQMAIASGRMTGFGTFKVGEQQKFANLLAESIVENGMQGRADQELQVLQGISDNLASRNTTVSEDTLRSGLNIYSTLATINPNLRGERGGNLAEKMINIAGHDNTSLDVMAGLGTEYLGVEGRQELRRLKESDPQAYYAKIWENMKRDMGEDTAKSYFTEFLVTKGGLSQHEADDALKGVTSGKAFNLSKDTTMGEEATEKRWENYKDSVISTLEQFDVALQDAKDSLGAWINRIKEPFKGVFNDLPQGGQMAATTAATVLPILGGGLAISKIGGAISAAGGIGGLLGGLANSGGLSGILGKLTGGATGSGGLGGLLSGITTANIGNILKFGKVGGGAVLGGIAAYNTYDAIQKDDYRGASESAAGGIGSIGGFLGGANTGAALGAFGGPIGMAIGAAVGGIVGGVAGDKIGEFAGGELYDLIAGEDKTSPAPRTESEGVPDTVSSSNRNKRPRSHIEEEMQQNPHVGPYDTQPLKNDINAGLGTTYIGVSGYRELQHLKESDPQSYYSKVYESMSKNWGEDAAQSYLQEFLVNKNGMSQQEAQQVLNSIQNINNSQDRFNIGGMRNFTSADQIKIIQQTGEEDTAVLGVSEVREPLPKEEEQSVTEQPHTTTWDDVSEAIETRAAHDAYNNLQQGNYRGASQDIGRGLVSSLIEPAGSALGAGAGVVIGKAIEDKPGAIAGAGLGMVTGSVGGYVVGDKLGKNLGGSIYDRFFGSDKELLKEEEDEEPRIIRTQAAYDAYNDVQQGNYREASQNAGRGLFASLVEHVSSAIGLSTGAAIGGAIGGAPGAVIGGGLGAIGGAIGGYLLGDKLGKKAGDSFYDRFFGNNTVQSSTELPNEDTAVLDTSEVREPVPTDDISRTPVVRDTAVSVSGIPTYSGISAETALAHNPALIDSRAGNFIPIRRDESNEDDNDNRGTVERQFRLMENDTRSTVDNTKALNDNTKSLEKNNKGTLMERIKNMFSNITGKTSGTPTSSGAPVVTSKSPVIATSPSQAGGTITKISRDYFGEGGAGEGITWKRQNDNVSFEGAQDGMLDAIDMLAKFYHEKTGNQLVVTAGTNGDHPSNGTPYGHNAGYKFDINDWGGGGEGALTGDSGTKGWFTDELIKYGRSLGLGMNWEGNHLDVSLVGDQWDGNGDNAGGFNPRKAVSSSSTSFDNNYQAKLVNTGNPLDDYATYMSDFGKERYGKDTPTAFWRTILRSEQGISNEEDTSYYNNPGGLDYAPYMSKEFGGTPKNIIDNGGAAHRIATFDTIEHGLQAQVDYFLNKDTHDWAKQEIDLVNQGKIEEAFRIHNEHYIANGKPLEEQGYWGAMREEFGRGNVRTGDDQRQPQFISPQSHAHGKDYVPYDNYPALLHKGERVLTRMEANELRDLPGTPIPLELQIDEDVDSISDKKFKHAIQKQYQYTTSHTFTSLPQLAIGGKVDNLGIHSGSSSQFQSMMLPKWVEKLLQSLGKTTGLNNILRSILPTGNNRLSYHIDKMKRRDPLSDLRNKLFNKDGSINLDSGLWQSSGVPKEIQNATTSFNPADKSVDQSIQLSSTTDPLTVDSTANLPKEMVTPIVSKDDTTEKKKTTPYHWIPQGAQYARKVIQMASRTGLGGKHNKTLSKVDRFLGRIARGSSLPMMVQLPSQPFNKDGSINLDSGLWTSKGWPQITKPSQRGAIDPELPKEIGTPVSDISRPEVMSEMVMKENPTQALTQSALPAQVATTTPIDTSSKGMDANSISIDLSVHVDGKIDGMTDANQGAIVTALTTRFKQPDWLSTVSNGYMRRANK